ncbi:MAG: hypothetical protein JWQ90_5045 [Hydrocarboniphaga sp.]|uniref:DUF2834 domain-containing protein n=1 Tax=Hydrocarboniphaga sp. TaxID=2033016 RepID=UPI002623AA37|nr:DUF2834 domain-containing protein [Hydrocarboniphaga sp.]MDB5972595.1 hypothetical protein [Hydrocarboniphaga sp.]
MSPSESFYVAIGLLSIVVIVVLNRQLYRQGGVSVLEGVCYLIAVPALVIGWYFNFQYMRGYGEQVGWWHWTTLLFVNPASASGGQDLIIANLLLFPLWTIVDGRRCGMRLSGWYFVMSLVTSYAFAFAVFMALRERQLRWNNAQRR